MSWKESKVRLLPPPQALSPSDRKPDIQDLFLLANQAANLKASLPLPPVDSHHHQQPNLHTSVAESTTSTGILSQKATTSFVPPLPLHPVKVEPGSSVISLPPPLPQPNRRLIDPSCAIMPPPPPPPPRTPTSPPTSVSSTSEDSEIFNHGIEFDGNDQVLCRVCGDKASGFHYGVHSCEGCKGFFRRSIQQKIQYRPCTKNQQCNILRINRNRCQYCRLKKCIAAGMSRDAVRFGRVPKREKAKILAAMQSSRMKTQESKVLGELTDDAKIIETIVRAHYDTCDYTRNKMEPFLKKAKATPKYISCTGATCPMKGRPEDSFLEHFSERFMDHVRQVCTFAKLIPGFKCLHHDDQVTLLKSCVFEVLLVRLAGLFDSQSLVCLNGDIIRKETINAMAPGNAKFLMDSVFELAQRMNQFHLSDAEIGLFCAVVIITPDRPGLRNPELLQRIQNKLKLVLSSILLPQHPEHASIFSELMTMVHDLRTLNTLHTEKFLQQCKINGNDHLMDNSSHFEATHQRWDSAQLDRESTGNGSPQSSSGGDTHSSTSLEDTTSRRSPLGSVSSTDSSSSTSEVAKLLSNVQDLRVNNSSGSVGGTSTSAANSVLMTALTAQQAITTGGVTISRKGPPITGSHHPVVASTSTSAVVAAAMMKYKGRNKIDSPIDSGIDSPKNQPLTGTHSSASSTHSTNNSVCSSPRSSLEVEDKGKQQSAASAEAAAVAVEVQADRQAEDHKRPLSVSPPHHHNGQAGTGNEERHPLLKRALQQPPQLYNNGVATFQDEVYKPHKKFRRHNNSCSGSTGSPDDCPSSSTQRSSSPEAGTSRAPTSSSLLASQLAEPPQTYSHHHQMAAAHHQQMAAAHHQYRLGQRSDTPPQEQPQSLLASTLSKAVPLASAESKRNEILAHLILEGGGQRFGATQQQQQQQQQQQGLLMCAPTTSYAWQPRAASSTTTSASTVAASASSSSRHIPVATVPTKPSATSRTSKPAATATSSSKEPSSALSQPLNLSTRTPPPPSNNVAEQQHSSSSQQHDIPTEA